MPIDPKKETPCRYGDLFRCRDCSFGMVLPRPAAEEIGDFYRLDNYYTHGHSHFAAPGPVTFADRLRLHLAWRLDFGEALGPEMFDQLSTKRPADVCDIGCGSGHLAAAIGRLGHRVVGVEVDQDALREAAGRGVEVHEGTIERLPEAVSRRRFDVVIMSHVLEHVLDPVRAVRATADLLAPGGRFVCVVPNNASAGLAQSQQAWEPLDIPRHLNFFVPANLEATCAQAGLRTRRLFFAGYCRQFGNDWINTERRIYEAMTRAEAKPSPWPRKNSRARAWWLLARTALARKEARYDQVGIIAERA